MDITDPATKGFDPDRLARILPWMQGWIDQGKFPGAQVLIARGGAPVFHATAGQMDIEGGRAWAPDTMVRIYSMTKPITSVGLLMLYEDAVCQLDQPVDDILPEFKDMTVLIDGAERIDQTRPAETRLTLHHLLTHTSGLTYGMNPGVLGEAMNAHRLGFSPRRQGPDGPMSLSADDDDLGAVVRELAALPLGFDPGARWNYSVSTDVLGRVIEVLSGQPLDQFLTDRILAPLGMNDTYFAVPEGKLDRVASCYVKTPKNPLRLVDPGDGAFAEGRVMIHSGGGGLISTAADYQRFADMLRGRGTLNGTRLLAPLTAQLMATNALPGDLASMGQPVFSEVPFHGIGFGLGVSVTLDPGLAKTLSSKGDFGWGGMASTVFWVDPVLDLTAIFLTQLLPSSAYPVRKEFRAMVYSSLTTP